MTSKITNSIVEPIKSSLWLDTTSSDTPYLKVYSKNRWKTVGYTGAADGTYATLVNGIVPQSQLPSYVDDVIEGIYVNSTTFNIGGVATNLEAGKIYISTDTNNQYRWTGTALIHINVADLSNYVDLTTDQTKKGTLTIEKTNASCIRAIKTSSSGIIPAIYASETWSYAIKGVSTGNDLQTSPCGVWGECNGVNGSGVVGISLNGTAGFFNSYGTGKGIVASCNSGVSLSLKTGTNTTSGGGFINFYRNTTGSGTLIGGIDGDLNATLKSISLSSTLSSAGITNTALTTAGIVTNTSSGLLGTVAAIPIENGGTNATTSATARTNLGAAASGVNSDITSLTGLTIALPISEGGTGSSTKNFVDLTTDQTVAGAKNFTGQITTGTSGIKIGSWAAASTTTASDYVALGDHTGTQITTASKWLAAGSYAAFNMKNYDMFTAIGPYAATQSASGSNWVAIGYRAACDSTNNTSSYRDFSNSVYVGANTIISSDGVANENVFGYNSTGAGSNTVSLGNSSCTGLYFAGTKFLDNSRNATLNTITSSALTTAGIVTNTSAGLLGTTTDYVSKTGNETLTGAKAFSDGAIFYGSYTSGLPTSVGNYLALYNSETYGLRLLGYNGANYQSFSLGARIGTTGSIFAQQFDASGNVSFNGASTKTNQLSQTIQTLTDATSISWDLTSGANAKLTLTDSVTARTISSTGGVAGSECRIIITQSSAATYPAVSWGTMFKFTGDTAPTLNTSANGVTMLEFFFDGTNYRLRNTITYNS